tara:strand:- start:5833 stop:6132 length:300 start_codon:yes stop_codon:yes gene_type:complete
MDLKLKKQFRGETSLDVFVWDENNNVAFTEAYVDWLEKQCNIADVSHCADDKEPIIAEIEGHGFTTPSNHGYVKLRLPYGHYKMKGWKKGDKIQIKHCC